MHIQSPFGSHTLVAAHVSLRDFERHGPWIRDGHQDDLIEVASSLLTRLELPTPLFGAAGTGGLLCFSQLLTGTAFLSSLIIPLSHLLLLLGDISQQKQTIGIQFLRN